MVHIHRVYTRTGDDGLTSLGNGARVSKTCPRIAAGGAVDETNSAIGLAIAFSTDAELIRTLTALQQFLFDLGADLCMPLTGDHDDSTRRIQTSDVEILEQLIDRATNQLQPLRSFVLPGGSPSAAALFAARAVCRRAELDVLKLHQTEPVNRAVLLCLNRLSDLLFVLARIANNCGSTDVLWKPGQGLKSCLPASESGAAAG